MQGPHMLSVHGLAQDLVACLKLGRQPMQQIPISDAYSRALHPIL